MDKFNNPITSVSAAARLDSDHDVLMRRFIRHPSSIPVKVDVIECGRTGERASMINVSRGGVCFESHVALPEGAQLHISIPIEQPPFEAVGQVAWCRPEADYYTVGLSFDDNSSAFSVRMVEQVCYIEHYRHSIAACEGRFLSSEEAANEWVAKYAADFPPH
ncbi:PilZ domain-containing protein [Agaribacterium haliotis]|uniref:PilZ domain-containing protein n=1 Tax=Agaribacterium haliotis TaxID=2013869 RepID=UPI0019563BD3|nr:PilZ domain-containing protein [Agaribacterium haliotis]